MIETKNAPRDSQEHIARLEAKGLRTLLTTTMAVSPILVLERSW